MGPERPRGGGAAAAGARGGGAAAGGARGGGAAAGSAVCCRRAASDAKAEGRAADAAAADAAPLPDGGRPLAEVDEVPAALDPYPYPLLAPGALLPAPSAAPVDALRPDPGRPAAAPAAALEL